MSERMKILIAYDGSDSADEAIDNMTGAGLPRDAEALIVQVRERWLPPPASYEVVEEVFGSTKSGAAKPVRAKEKPDRIEEESPYLQKASKKLSSYFPDWHIETIFLNGSPSHQIIREANEWKADLIIVGSQGQTRNKLFQLGSVSQKIANEAPCSVRVVRGNSWKKGAPSRILIGLDGTPAAQAAVEEVARRMWMMSSKVRLITARDFSKNKEQPAVEKSKTEVWIESFLENAGRVLENSELEVSQIVEEGDPKQIICRAADEWGADCIFIGSNETGNFYYNLLLGGVATAVVNRAHCTVEIVRHRN